MKESKVLRLGALLVSLLLIFTLAAGCGDDGKVDKTSGSSSKKSSSSAPSESAEDAESARSGETAESAVSTAGNTSSAASKAASAASAKVTSTGGKINPEDYRGTTVRYATWKDPSENEDGDVVASFKRNYGINVVVDMINQGEYVQKLGGMVAAGNAPDVFFDNNEWPGSLTVLQPLEAAKMDLKDPIWDKYKIEASTIGGKPYLVDTVGNIWSETNMCYYNKKLLADNNIKDPQYYIDNKSWTYDALKKIMSETKALGKDYFGGHIDPEILPASTGASFFQLKNGKLSSGLDDPMLANVTRFIAECNKEGLICLRDDFKSGKAGICIIDAFGLKKTGHWSKMNASHIGFAPIPAYDKNTPVKDTGLFRGWGIIKGSKNPVGAGIFIRYYLDVNNYDLKSAFINTEAKDFFFKLTANNSAQKQYYILSGLTQITGINNNQFRVLFENDPAQISTQLGAMKNTVDNAVKKGNASLEEQAKLYK